MINGTKIIFCQYNPLQIIFFEIKHVHITDFKSPFSLKSSSISLQKFLKIYQKFFGMFSTGIKNKKSIISSAFIEWSFQRRDFSTKEKKPYLYKTAV